MVLSQYELAEADLKTYLRLSTGKSVDDPDIKRAYHLLDDCMRKARETGAAR
jgi:cysteine sulfinate desulfinase/cysteine desulfurase-like protein